MNRRVGVGIAFSVIPEIFYRESQTLCRFFVKEKKWTGYWLQLTNPRG